MRERDNGPDVSVASRPSNTNDSGAEPAGEPDEIMPLMPFLPDPQDHWLAQDINVAPARERGYRDGPSQLASMGSGLRVVVIGASGGIGTALTDMLEEDRAVSCVFAFSRTGSLPYGGNIVAGHIDLTDELSIEHAAAAVAQTGPIHLVVVASGCFRAGDRRGAEHWQGLDAAAMMRSFQVNTTGPALIAKHFLPLMAPSSKTVFAALSESPGRFDQRDAPFWYAYHASKAALAAVIEGLAGEMRGTDRETLCVGLFPGSVDTALVHDNGSLWERQGLVSPDLAGERLLAMIDQVGSDEAGTTLIWDEKRPAARELETAAGAESTAA